MNKKTVIASLNEIANELDNTGFYSEANRVTQVMIKISQDLKDVTYEDIVEGDKRRKKEYEQILADKEKRKIGDEEEFGLVCDDFVSDNKDFVVVRGIKKRQIDGKIFYC